MSTFSGADELVADPSRVKSRITGLIFVAAVIAITVIANLPYEYVALKGRWVGNGDIENRGGPGVTVSMPEMAGWPLNYSVSYPDERESERFFSWSTLILNAAIGLCVSVLVYFFIQWRHLQIQQRSPGVRRFLSPDLGIAFAILFVPGSIVGYHFLQYRHHIDLARRVSRHGNCYVACWLPRPIVPYVPEGMQTWMLRVRWVSFDDFREKPELESEICGVPTIVGLSVRRNGIQVPAIEELHKHLHFHQLMLNAADLNTAHLDAIRKLPWLVELSLRGSNLDGSMLRQLDTMSLVAVDLGNTKISLSEIGRPGWADTVAHLTLTRPRQGVADSLTIDDWPNLESLRVTRFVTDPNEAPLSLELTNLPRLSYLQIDRLQKHEIVLRNVPRLAEIDDGIGQFGFSIDRSLLFPGHTWASSMEVENAPSLRILNCFVRDLESMEIRNTPNLRRLAMGSFLTTMLGDFTQQSADSERCQQWVNLIGQQDGPGTVNLHMLPLRGLDLSPLAKNRRIRILNLDRTEIEFEQLRTLAEMTQLEHLDIRSCRLRRDELSWLLEHFEKLENLMVDGSGLEVLDLRQPLRLKRLVTRKLERVSNLHMLDLPRLGTEVRLIHAPQELELRNAQALRGLGLERDPWPENAVVSGIRDLEWFSAGGPAVDDALMDELLQCRLLDKLTLAYCNVSRDKLMRLNQLPKLTVLAVPGADIDDEVTVEWMDLQGLLDLNLNDTRVGVGTIARLGLIKPLRRLSLSRVPLDAEAVKALPRLENLSQLILAGVDVPPKHLPSLFAMPELESLDLSGVPVDESWVPMIRNSRVRHLVLRGSDISASTLKQMLQSKPTLYIDLGMIPDSIDDETVMELRDRAKAVVASFRQGWQQVFALSSPFTVDISSLNGGWEAPDDLRQSVTVGMPRAIGRIDIEQFRPQVAAND